MKENIKSHFCEKKRMNMELCESVIVHLLRRQGIARIIRTMLGGLTMILNWMTNSKQNISSKKRTNAALKVSPRCQKVVKNTDSEKSESSERTLKVAVFG